MLSRYFVICDSLSRCRPCPQPDFPEYNPEGGNAPCIGPQRQHTSLAGPRADFSTYARRWNAGPRALLHSKTVRRYTYGEVSFFYCSNNINPIRVMMITYTTVFVLLSLFFRSSSAFPGLNLLPRTFCYETDILLSFQSWLPDSVPYCSSLLSITDYTTFSGPTKSHTYAVILPDCTDYSRMAGLPLKLLLQLATMI